MSGSLFSKTSSHLSCLSGNTRRLRLRAQDKKTPAAAVVVALSCGICGFLAADHASAQQPVSAPPTASATASAAMPAPPPPLPPPGSASAVPPPPATTAALPPPPPPPVSGPAASGSAAPPPGYGPYGPYYYPYPYYGAPYSTETPAPPPPPPPPTKRANPAMMGIGIAMTSLGIVGVLSGLASFATANNRIDIYCDGGFQCGTRDDEDLQVAGGVLMIVGGVFVAGGIPLWVIGAKRVPLKDGENPEKKPSEPSPPPAQATLKIGPGSAGIQVSF